MNLFPYVLAIALSWAFPVDLSPAFILNLILPYYQAGLENMALLYDRILRHRKIIVDKKDTMWNWSFNMPCKSLKGILVLFEEEKPYTRDTSKFYNPKIQKVSVIVEGKPNQLYAQRMKLFEQYDEAHKYFAEGSQKDNNFNEVQKHLQLHNVSVGEYLTDRYALWLDFRMIDENELHGTGRRIENALEGITLHIKKKEESAGALNAYIYSSVTWAGSPH